MNASAKLFSAPNLSDHQLETEMIREIDAALGTRPRQDLPVDTVLFTQDQPLEKIWILEQGKVILYQIIDGEEVIFHSQTVGRILGLLAFASQHNAFFSCRAVTPIRILELSLSDLENALSRSPGLPGIFMMVLLRSMARRNRRAVELQTEVLSLNADLAAERDQLQRTLEELRQTQSLLVESGKMATLGQMAAGIAHELNNPVGAISRATDFIQSDLHALGASLPDGPVFQEMLDRALTLPPLSTREQRAIRAQLETETADPETARRAADLGIRTASELRDLTSRLHAQPDTPLDRLELFHQIGSSLRNINRCSGRITDLVTSLRNYTRVDERFDRIDIHPGIDDTLHLMANRLFDVTVEKRYEATRTPEAIGGQLNQVWTNIIANALDAMGNKGSLLIATRDVPEGIHVIIEDSGPGIPPEHLQKIFELQFTTRKGRVDFGLGLGLSICRNIIARHHGRIEVASRPGQTTFTIFLPAPAPAPSTSSKENHHE
ncbi:MAG TPA: ATP-binding protein [Kiritimatiellia bacterium]|nr:ATP-binding protein [Kiritimatiellia bacterium]